MPSKYARQALSETPLELRENVIKIANKMKNLKQLAEERALEAYPRVINDPYNPMEDDNKCWRDVWIEGFIDHAKLAAEDKKELLEALKDLLYIDKIMYEGEHRKIIARVNEVIEKHETI